MHLLTNSTQLLQGQTTLNYMHRSLFEANNIMYSHVFDNLGHALFF